MSEQERKDFDDRLAELSNWQIEQQKKLKAFQEAQRKLLDLEHQKILNGFNTRTFEQRFNKCSENNSNNEKEEMEFNVNDFNNKNGIFQLKFPKIRLSEPKSTLFGLQDHSLSAEKSDEFFSESVGDSEERAVNKPRKFLRRGEGLARFRMTLDDFKAPPQIYKEKKIKTYLNSKPGSKATSTSSSRSSRSTKSCVKTNKCPPTKAPVKSAPVPVKIYVPEKKPCLSGRSTEGKQMPQIVKKFNCPKSPLESLNLKQHNIATEWYNAMKAKEKVTGGSEDLLPEKNKSASESDVETRKDEKELRIFEILEKKVDDMSFCSNSSFVDKLMEQSLSSTPAKSSRETGLAYMQGLKSLRSQFLDEEQVKKFEELDVIPFEGDSDGTETEIGAAERNDSIAAESEVKACGEVEEEPRPGGNAVEVAERTGWEPPTHKVNKMLLQEYIKDFKDFKFLLAENAHRIEDEETTPKELPKEEEKDKQEHPREQDMALKLRRKGLQDNVKHLLNWECPPRKRQPKRVVKKIKSRPKLEKSKTASKEQSEKIVFSSSLLHDRLNELEKEIEIFRKENRNLERLQKECNEERTKLARERKELQKQIQEEREQLESKMAEEQKKLQKERTVFEKYCKQVKGQPTRQEREETTKLKKEVEKLTDTLTTKEARWGASQARLRNQIKILEKENASLKAEVEKYKKLSAKKVSFENERNLSTKIIHVINSELGKLKPAVIKDAPEERNPSLSARIDRNLPRKPIRRIKSAPNVKKQTENDLCVEACSEPDEKALGSVSTDSGIETNGCRHVQQRGLPESKIGKEATTAAGQQEQSGSSGCRSPLFGTDAKKPESSVESAVRDAIFGDVDMAATSIKIAEVKSRLERLSLLGCGEDGSDSPATKMARLGANRAGSESYGSDSSVEEEEEEEEEDEEEQHGTGKLLETDCPLRRSCFPGRQEASGMLAKGDSLGAYPQRVLVESKPGENGIWEKLFEDGSKEISYPNGNVKKIFPGSKIVRMSYYNGDIKETDVAEGSEKYYYAETKTWHTTYKDGLEVLEFPNGQTERRHADGSTEISFPNGCVRYCDSSGRDEWRFLDGTVIKTNHCGHKILLMPNGQKEIHTKEFKRREYPDGTVKILYSDGTQETRYASGRVRLKDKDGNLVMDSGGIR